MMAVPEKGMYYCESLRKITCKKGTSFGNKAIDHTSPDLVVVEV